MLKEIAGFASLDSSWLFEVEDGEADSAEFVVLNCEFYEIFENAVGFDPAMKIFQVGLAFYHL